MLLAALASPPLAASPGAAACIGDCNDDGAVRASEVASCIGRVLRCDGAPTGTCSRWACDGNGDGVLSAGDAAQAVLYASAGCPPTGFCTADCNGNGVVSEEEINRCFGAVIEPPDPASCTYSFRGRDCRSCDANGDGGISAAEVAQAIDNALRACPSR